jgi:hypothetical protein
LASDDQDNGLLQQNRFQTYFTLVSTLAVKVNKAFLAYQPWPKRHATDCHGVMVLGGACIAAPCLALTATLAQARQRVGWTVGLALALAKVASAALEAACYSGDIDTA